MRYFCWLRVDINSKTAVSPLSSFQANAALLYITGLEDIGCNAFTAKRNCPSRKDLNSRILISCSSVMPLTTRLPLVIRAPCRGLYMNSPKPIWNCATPFRLPHSRRRRCSFGACVVSVLILSRIFPLLFSLCICYYTSKFYSRERQRLASYSQKGTPAIAVAGRDQRPAPRSVRSA
jgi:hypothetical protein